MVQQWLRKVSLTAADVGKDGIELSALRIVFTVNHIITNVPATLHARIYNLSKSTAQKLLDMKSVPVGMATPFSLGQGGDPNAAKVTLQAGYEGNFGIIFRGDLIQSKHGRESGTDTYVDLFAGDGDWAHTWGRINTTLAAGYLPRDVNDAFKQVAQPLGMTVTDLPDGTKQIAAPRGKTMYGMSRDFQSDLARTNELNCFPRFGQLEWLPQAASRPGDTVVVNATTGMVGMPTQTNFGLAVQMLLNPSVGPGALLKIDNKSIQLAEFQAGVNETFRSNKLVSQTLNANEDTDGAYKVLGVNHKGDTRGNDWYTEAECIATNPVGGQVIIPPQYGTAWL
jgi:hypothetical protein